MPTALFCDPAYALAGIPSSDDGRNPLPEAHYLQDWFSRWGLEEGSRVVVYDEGARPHGGPCVVDPAVGGPR